MAVQHTLCLSSGSEAPGGLCCCYPCSCVSVGLQLRFTCRDSPSRPGAVSRVGHYRLNQIQLQSVTNPRLSALPKASPHSTGSVFEGSFITTDLPIAETDKLVFQGNIQNAENSVKQQKKCLPLFILLSNVFRGLHVIFYHIHLHHLANMRPDTLVWPHTAALPS